MKHTITLIHRIGLGLLLNCLMGALVHAQSAAPSSTPTLLTSIDFIKADEQQTQQRVSLKQFLSQLEEQYGVHFAYPEALVISKAIRPRTKESAQTVESLLKQTLTPLSISFTKVNDVYILQKAKPPLIPLPRVEPASQESSLDLPDSNLERITSIGVQQSAAAIDQTITGQVTDLSTDEPLPGVNVVVKGTTIGAVTNVEGNYRLTAPDDADTLIFSSVGYESEEIAIGNQTVIDLAMAPDIQSLAEIVVVGYGEQSRQNVTGAVAEVDVETIKNTPNTNVSQALRGRVAGVQFQDNGRPGQNGEIIVRGRSSITASNNPLIVLDGVFFNGSLADINPNDVASMEVLKDASASAIYGARAANGVILVTTKKGTSAKPTISFNAYYGVSDWSNQLNLLTPERYLQKTLDWRRATDQPADPNAITDYLSPEEQENYRNGRTLDPWEEISQNASIQSYDLSVSGKLENTNYYLSLSYNDEEGLILGDDAQRISVRTNLQTSLSSWLNVGLTSQFSSRNLSGVEASTSNAYWLSPYGQLFDDGDLVPYPTGETLNLNPLFETTFNDNEEVFNNLFANFFITVDAPFLEGLSYRLNLSPNLRWNHEYDFSPSFAGDVLTRFSEASKLEEKHFDWVIENIVNYKVAFGDAHELDATFLYGRNQFNFKSTLAEASFFFNNATGWDNLNLAEVQNTFSDRTQLDQTSLMARLNYRLLNKYLFTFTARRDGSSVFGSNNKWGTFPSAAIAWVASEEPFVQNLSFINYLKVRASYGRIGNQGLDPYSSLNRLETVQYVYGDGSPTYVGLSPDQMGNPNLGWETSVSANLAVEFGLLKNRLGGTIELYSTQTEDLLLERAIPETNGFTSVLQNIGKTENRGIEVSLNSTNVESDKFRWVSDVVLTHNRNKIVSLYGIDADNDGVEDNDVSNCWIIGEPVLIEYDFLVEGIWQEDDDIPDGFQPGDTRVRDLTGNGELTPDDRTVIGQREPNITWGLNNRFTYGPFELSVFLNGQHGFIRRYDPLDPSNRGGNFPERAVNMLDEGDGWWTPENRSNTRPALNFRNPLGHQFYADRDFVRIQDVSLSYNVNTSLLERFQLGSLRVYVSGRNLATFTDWPGWDPESGNFNRFSFPTARTIIGGINLSF